MKPSSLAAVPLASISIAFISGILLADYFAIRPSLHWMSGCAVLLFCLYIVAHAFSLRWRPKIKSTILFLLLTLMGAGAFVSCQEYWQEDHFSKKMVAQNNLIVKALEQTKSGLVVEVVEINSRPAKGRLLVVGKKIEALPHLNYLKINGIPKRILGPKNPYAFDFAKYCRRLGFAYELKPVHPPEILARSAGRDFLGITHQFRQRLLDRLDHYVSDEKLCAVAKAMLLGDRRALHGELKVAYVDAGIIHVLAISGLHLGIVYLALLWLWSMFPGLQKTNNKLRAIVVLLLLWMFVVLSGCSSSAVRAATMFSFFEGAKLIGQGKYSINTLCASALFMLLINPNFLFNVGFQLSYLAVFGILLLQRPIEDLFGVKHKVLKTSWQIISLSLAAQVFTLPLTLYYFHQFPILFAITSFFAVPLTALIVKVGLLFLALHNIPFVGDALLVVLQAALSLINLIATDLSGSFDLVIRNIWLSSGQCVLWFGAMAGLAWLIISKSWRAALACLLLALLLQITFYYQDSQQVDQQFFTCYFVEGKSYGVYVENTHAVKLMPHAMKAFEVKRSSMDHLLRHGIVKDTTLDLVSNSQTINACEKLMMGESICCIVRDSLTDPEFVWDCNLVWICDAGAKTDFVDSISDKTVIVDGSTTSVDVLTFLDRHKEHIEQIHDIRRDGALTINLKTKP